MENKEESKRAMKRASKEEGEQRRKESKGKTTDARNAKKSSSKNSKTPKKIKLPHRRVRAEPPDAHALVRSARGVLGPPGLDDGPAAARVRVRDAGILRHALVDRRRAGRAEGSRPGGAGERRRVSASWAVGLGGAGPDLGLAVGPVGVEEGALVGFIIIIIFFFRVSVEIKGEKIWREKGPQQSRVLEAQPIREEDI